MMMASDVISSPASEFISQVVEGMIEMVSTANNVLIKKESFQELAGYLERIIPILKELSNRSLVSSESLTVAIDILNHEVKAGKQLTLECSTRNKVYLLMNCRGIVKRLGDCTSEISRGLGLLPLVSLDLSSNIIDEIGKVCESMQRAEFKAALAEEDILEKIESGIQERNVDRTYANNLLARIAEAVGISTERSAVKKELEEFKSEIENAQLRKHLAEAIQMDQIINLLERADAASSPKEKEMRYFTKRKSLGCQPLEPLQSFYCPITRDVMVDPVEISSGQTFERNAIEKWLADGNNYCPLTMIALDTSFLRPNKTLRQSIEEWKDRNTMITIASMKSKLVSEAEEEVLHSLGQLEDLCERDQHREWVILENYIPTLIRLLSAKNCNIRNRSLVVLCILVKDSDDAKERVANADNAIQLIVRSLGRRVVERKLAVELLLELSKSNLAKQYIGQVQGCILLLVTMSSSDESQAATTAAKMLLENLAFSDQNVVQMARANYFKHLLNRLSTGAEEVKLLMASTLAELELTDNHKASLFEGGVLPLLLQLISVGDIRAKEVGVRALQNLSSLPANGLQMIREGAVGPLLDLLFRHLSPSSVVREQVSAIVMNLALSTASQELSEIPLELLESEEDTFKLFSLITLSGPDVQPNVLRAFYALCHSPSASEIKNKLTEYSALQILLQLCEHENPTVRADVVKLLSCLVKDCDEDTILEHVNQKSLENLLKIIESSSNAEEMVAVLCILSDLPDSSQIANWLLEAGAIPLIYRFMSDFNKKDAIKNQFIEYSAGALRRFTVPTNVEWQKKVAECGAIPVLVQLLDVGTPLTKKYAAISLECLSKSSLGLSRPIHNRKHFWCFAPPPPAVCVIHKGVCSVQFSFCLVQADAVEPLARVLEDPDPYVCLASLNALLTLIEGERLQSGSKVLAEATAIPRIISLLRSSSPMLQEQSLRALERIFRLQEFKQKYGPSAQMPLVDLTQRGTSTMKSLAARILAHLNVLHDQSSFF